VTQPVPTRPCPAASAASARVSNPSGETARLAALQRIGLTVKLADRALLLA